MSPELFAQSFTSANLSWLPPIESFCITSYTVTLTNITEGNTSFIYNTTANTTSTTLSDLTEGAEYSYTVAAVDTGGRVGEESMAAKPLTLDSN